MLQAEQPGATSPMELDAAVSCRLMQLWLQSAKGSNHRLQSLDLERLQPATISPQLTGVPCQQHSVESLSPVNSAVVCLQEAPACGKS